MEKQKYSTTEPNSHIIFPQISPSKDNNRKKKQKQNKKQKTKNKKKKQTKNNTRMETMS
jgi:hypothetical protein